MRIKRIQDKKISMYLRQAGIKYNAILNSALNNIGNLF